MIINVLKMRLTSWIENRWFKRRHIYTFISKANIIRNNNVIQISGDNLNDYSFKWPGLQTNKFDERLRRSDTLLWIYVEDSVVKAYAWANTPKCLDVWHDSLPTRTGEVRIFNVWTDPNYRSQGIGKSLVSTVVYDLLELGYNQIWCVIEDSNIASKRMFVKCDFRLIGVNLLLKCFGVNLMSYYNSMFYFLFRGKKSRL